MKVLKDFYQNKCSPRELASINSTVNGKFISLVTNKSNAKRAVTSFFKSYSFIIYRRWIQVFVTMADMRFFKTESRNSFTIYSRYVKRHDVTESVQGCGLSQRLFQDFFPSSAFVYIRNKLV